MSSYMYSILQQLNVQVFCWQHAVVCDNVSLWYVRCVQLSVEIQMAAGSSYSLELDLLHPILPDRSVFKPMSTKVSEFKVM